MDRHSVRQEDFDNEVHMVAQLLHPRLVLLQGVCVPQRCLVYELMAGGSLEDHLLDDKKRLRLSFHDRVSVLLDASEGLAHLHRKRIYHRDIKPANILLDRKRGAKLADVGLAKLMPEHKDIASKSYKPSTDQRDSCIAGTQAYMDPQYFNSGVFRHESDVYSLGVTMLRTFTARDPQKEGFRDSVEDAVEEGSEAAIWAALDPCMHAHPPLDIVLQCLKMALECYNSNRQDRRPPLTKGVRTRSKHEPILDVLKDVIRKLEEWEESNLQSMRLNNYSRGSSAAQ